MKARNAISSLLVLLTTFFTTVPLAHAEEAGLRLLRRDLAQATTAYERAIQRCTPESSFTNDTIRQIKRIDLPPTQRLRALGWLALERRAACERPERQELAEAIIRLRTALKSRSHDTGNIDRLAETLWDDALRLSRLRAEYESLPESIRNRFASIPALQRPFALGDILDALSAPMDIDRLGRSDL